MDLRHVQCSIPSFSAAICTADTLTRKQSYNTKNSKSIIFHKCYPVIAAMNEADNAEDESQTFSGAQSKRFSG